MPLFQPAVKEQLKARVAIDGPTGSGKTWTALQWATILAEGNPVGLIDTENRSAAYYAPTPGVEPNRVQPWSEPYDFGHMPVSPPYDPRQLRQLIQAAGSELGEGGVLIIDSLTHYWNGDGGTLDIVDNASSRGNTFTGWKEGTPAQRGMLDAIIHAPFHVIVTMRSKMEYVLETVEKGGRTTQVPVKKALAPEQRAGVEYEFTVVADMDLEHRLVVSKSRCSLLADLVVPNGRSHEPAIIFRDWLGTGVLRITPQTVAAIAERFRSIHDEEERRALKAKFVTHFGAPGELLQERMDEAETWLNENLATPTPDPTLLDNDEENP